ncbi:thioredoxin [Mycobacterium tuberculosis]|nr:thioredoxin [Mycobacterium tuberculosis]
MGALVRAVHEISTTVMPATVVLRPDGSVAQTLPRAFGSADEIVAAVGNDAG